MRREPGSTSTSVPVTLNLALEKQKMYSLVLHSSTHLPRIKGKEGNLQVQVCPGLSLQEGARKALAEG